MFNSVESSIMLDSQTMIDMMYLEFGGLSRRQTQPFTMVDIQPSICLILFIDGITPTMAGLEEDMDDIPRFSTRAIEQLSR